MTALTSDCDWVEVLHRPRKSGLGQAYQAGFARALAGGAHMVIEMDADFSHNPAYLPRLLAAAESADLVLGSRYVPGGGVRDWGLLRRLVSRGGGLYARRIRAERSHARKVRVCRSHLLLDRLGAALHRSTDPYSSISSRDWVGSCD